MAHSCPECGSLCFCGGDIDDCEFEGTPEEANCTHCVETDDDEEFDGWDDDSDEGEGFDD